MTAARAAQLADRTAYERTVGRFRETRTVLPTFAQLADPTTIPAARAGRLAGVDPDAPDPLNLFRVHWYNGRGPARPSRPSRSTSSCRRR